MRFFLMFGSVFFTAFFVFSAQTDSLKVELSKTKSGIKKNELYLQLGIECYRVGQYDDAKIYLNNAITGAKKINQTKVILNAHNNLGNVYADLGDNANSLKNYQLALKLAEESKDLNRIAHINKNIGALFVSFKRFNEGLFYYFKAEKAAIQFKDSLLFADCNNNIGTVFEQQEKYSDAINRYLLALKIYKKYNENGGVAMAYSNLAIVYKLKGDFKKAIEYNYASIDLSKKLGDQWSEAATLNNLGNLYGEYGNYEKSIFYCKESLELSKKINAPEIELAAQESLAEAAYKNRDFKIGYDYLLQYTHTKDSFNNSEINKQLSELNIKYETEKKERINQELKIQNTLKATELEKTTQERNAIIVFVSVFFIIGFMVLRLVQRNRRIQQALTEQKLIQETSFSAEQSERKRLARDLHDQVGQKLAVVKMHLSMKNENAVSSATELLDSAIKDVRAVSHDLMPPDLELGLSQALFNLAEQINYTTDKKLANFTIDPKMKEVKLDIQREVTIYRIVQEIISNSLKYSNADNIDLNLDCVNNEFHLIVSDNGIGFDTSTINLKSGIGLQNINYRIINLGGTFTLSSEINHGTRYEIKIPL